MHLWYNAAVRMLVANCSVEYEGRLGARLPPALRLIMLKADGSIAVHADAKAYKPLNWMTPPCTVREQDRQLVATNPGGEKLTIELHEVLHDYTVDLGDDPGPAQGRGRGGAAGADRRSGWLALRDDLLLVRREYPTDIGPVDLSVPRRRRRGGGDRGEARRRDRRRRAAAALPGAPRPRRQPRADARDVRRDADQAAGASVRAEPGRRVRRDRPRGAARRRARSISGCSERPAMRATARRTSTTVVAVVGDPETTHACVERARVRGERGRPGRRHPTIPRSIVRSRRGTTPTRAPRSLLRARRRSARGRRRRVGAALRRARATR